MCVHACLRTTPDFKIWYFLAVKTLAKILNANAISEFQYLKFAAYLDRSISIKSAGALGLKKKKFLGPKYCTCQFSLFAELTLSLP